MKKGLIITLVIVVVAAVAGGVWHFYLQPKMQPAPQPAPQPVLQPEPEQPKQPEPKVQPKPVSKPKETAVEAKQEAMPPSTNKKVVYTPEKVANPLLVGLWVDDTNPQHYKWYLDDPCDEEEGLFWGKEWDESQNIFEDDLAYHGNGWFKWSKTKKEMMEIYMSDQEMMVPAQYTIDKLNDSIYIYKKTPNRVFSFHRI